MPLPSPSEQLGWPCWFYPPETTEEDPAAHGRIFQRAEDVPEGWAVNWRQHGANLEREPPAAPEAKTSRLDLFRELKVRDIPHGATLSTAALQALLDEALEAERLDASV